MNLPGVLYRTAGRVYPEATWADFFARVKFCVRALSAPIATARWFRQLESPSLVVAAREHPRIYSKLQRPYLHRRLGLRDRLTALTEHYTFLRQRTDESLREAVFSTRGHLLAVLPTPEPDRYSLRLQYHDQFEKEGELTVVLFDAHQEVSVFTLTFTVTRWSGGNSELFVGGLQGHKGANDREEVVRLTRSLHGLRPKALLLFTVQRLAQCWGIECLRAVGDSEHIYRHYRKRREISASYDSFWVESQGVRNPDGNYSLPERPTVRRMDELPANKRSLYRRRYAMLEELGSTISGQLRMPESTAARLRRRASDAYPTGSIQTAPVTTAEPGLLRAPAV